MKVYNVFLLLGIICSFFSTVIDKFKEYGFFFALFFIGIGSILDKRKRFNLYFGIFIIVFDTVELILLGLGLPHIL